MASTGATMKAKLGAVLSCLAVAAAVFLLLEVVGAASKPLAWALAVIASVVIAVGIVAVGRKR